MKINCQFDGGSIEIVSIKAHQATLEIRRDTHAEFRQWFYFQVNVERLNNAYAFEILNAGRTSYPKGWQNYHPCISYDRQNWQRVATSEYDSKVLRFSLTPKRQQFYLAYFAPFSYEQHLNLIAKAQCHQHVTHHILGQTPKGRNIDLLEISKANKNAKNIWIIARQHPGETMAEWFMQGLIHRLLEQDNPSTEVLLKQIRFYLIPNMNVDGAYLGNLRVNACGRNLNREWQSPSLTESPEVYHVREKIKQSGVDLFLDIHGDEEIPYNFISGSDGIPNLNDDILQAEKHFSSGRCAPALL